MYYAKVDIRNKNSLEDAALYVYLLDDSPKLAIRTRPVVIICPGGGYAGTSDREAEIMALQFNAMGYHAAVLRYSVRPAVFPTALLELGSAVGWMYEHAAQFHVNTNQIVLTGFSAGGHLVCSYCEFWNQKWVEEALRISSDKLRPGAMILGYPVITAGEFGNYSSFQHLLGDAYETKKMDLSLEKHVGSQVPRAFIWHTFEDQAVPVQNSLLLVNELVKNGIPVEFHLFEKGPHGLSLANRRSQSIKGTGLQPGCECWIEMAYRWLEEWILRGE